MRHICSDVQKIPEAPQAFLQTPPTHPCPSLQCVTPQTIPHELVPPLLPETISNRRGLKSTTRDLGVFSPEGI